MVFQVKNLQLFQVVIDDRQSADQKWIELHRLKLALRTVDYWLKLTEHQIDDYWRVSHEVSFPGFFSHNKIRPSVVVFSLSVGFFFDSVEIFMNTVEQIWNKLSWVVLVVAHEHGLVLADGSFELGGWDRTIRAHPETFQEFGVGCRKLTLGSKLVLLVDFLEIFIGEEVFGEFGDVTKTL